MLPLTSIGVKAREDDERFELADGEEEFKYITNKLYDHTSIL
jgi:hypothetical protein